MHLTHEVGLEECVDAGYKWSAQHDEEEDKEVDAPRLEVVLERYLLV